MASVTITPKICTNYPSFYDYGTLVGGLASLTIDYNLCSDFPNDAYFVLQAPKVNQDYESLGNPTLTSVFPSSLTATIAVAGESGSPFTSTVTPSFNVVVDYSAHQADGKTYDQIQI